MNFGKAALLFGSLAFQMHMLTIAFDGYTVTRGGSGSLQERDDAIKAFLILAFLGFLASQILLLLMHFGDFHGNKIVSIIVMILLLAASVFVLIGISIYGDTVGSQLVPAYSMSTYVLGLSCGLVASILLMFEVCCGSK